MKLIGFAGVPAPGAAAVDWQHYLGLLGHAARSASLPDGAFAAVVGGASHAAAAHAVAIVKGDLRWKDSSLAPAGTDAAQQILGAYERFGEEFLTRLEGAFALAVIDLQRRRVLLALDRMGIERLTYATQGSHIAFGTSAQELARAPGRERSLDSQALYDFLLLHMVPAPNTIYAGVRKLRPGTVLVFENGTARIRSYWQPAFARDGEPDQFAAWKTQLHESLAEAVRRCEPDDRTGAFLSGGLDSSSVAGKLAEVRGGHPVPTFSMGFGVAEYDELRYARIASTHFKCKPLEYDITPEDVVHAFPLIAKAYDEPFGNSSAVPTYFCALRAREQGVTHLLAGDGGDEIFGGNERYVRQAVFEHYRKIPGLLRALIEPASKLIPAEFPFAPLRKARSYVEQARIPLPERLEAWNFIYQTGISTMLEPQFERRIDPRAPLATMQEVYDAAPTDSMLHQMLFYDWHFTLSDNDLRKVGSMCELAGVKVSYPMLDPRVLELSLRIPPNRKIEGTQLRAFYKKAMVGFLPNEILTKQKHGFGLPFGVWLKTHAGLRELIHSLLDGLKTRGIVQPRFLDRLLEQHRDGHASYFGYAIWDLAMLEAWLQAHT